MCYFVIRIFNILGRFVDSLTPPASILTDFHRLSLILINFHYLFGICMYFFHDPFASSVCFCLETFLPDYHHDLCTAKLVSKNQVSSMFVGNMSSYVSSCFKCIDFVSSCMLRNYVRQQYDPENPGKSVPSFRT